MISYLKKALAALVILGGIFGIIIYIKGKQFAPQEMPQFPPTPITTEAAVDLNWKPSVRAIGELEASQGVLVSGESPGIIETIHFQSGKLVNKGDLLVTLNTEVERADLAAAEANLELAEVNLRRTRRLVEQETTAQAELDQADAEAKRARAIVNSIRARIDRKEIRAPFSGRLGIELVDVGQYLGGGDPVVNLQQIDPMRILFKVPQVDVGLVGEGHEVEVRTDSYPDRIFSGVVTALEAQVDPVTRTLEVEARIDNEGGLLRPGMFAIARVILPEDRRIVAVPETAVYYQSFGDSIFVVQEGESGMTVEQRFVKLGERRGDFVEVLSNLKSGEVVASSGVFRLRDGGPVVLDNETKPVPEEDPQPENS